MTLKRIALGLAALVLAVVLAGAVLFSINNDPLPETTDPASADALAKRMLAAIDDEAWQRTGAVTWTFRGAHHHLWDRQRSYARVRWDDHEVLIDLTTRRGVARIAGEPVAGEEALAPLLQKAWALWCNDEFWLNPISKVFDDGTRRGMVGEDLLVTYTEGGVTPGDSYLWTVGDDGLPTSWRMWTSIIPLGGLETSWEGWITLDTGVKVATRHATFAGDLELGDIRGAASLAELEPGPDPFAELAALLAGS
ncbi:MAG: hypothetical protein AAF560_07685 [Acidobacteriota bacterium]